MKKTIIWIFCLLILAYGSFALGRYYHHYRYLHQDQDFTYVDHRFRPTEFPKNSRSFVFFICAYNNGAFVEKTLRSISNQVYDNYRLIYIDDASIDGSNDLARECINQSRLSDRTTFVHNDQKLGQLASLIKAAHDCDDQEILIIVQGDGWLAHEWVLNRLNQYYADSDLWLTYSQYREYPTYHLGISRSYQQSEWNQLRQAPFLATHLATFYTALLKHINEADLQMQGAFLLEKADLAMMLPLLEMAQDHFQFINEIQYIENFRASSDESREEAFRCERYIRSLSPYHPITSSQLRWLDSSTIKEDV